MGGENSWPYKEPQNHGCWENVSCYHGVAATFRAFAAIPTAQRSTDVQARLDEAIDGRVMLVKNYGRKLIDPIPLEPIGQPSRFLTYEWLRTQRLLGTAAEGSEGQRWK